MFAFYDAFGHSLPLRPARTSYKQATYMKRLDMFEELAVPSIPPPSLPPKSAGRDWRKDSAKAMCRLTAAARCLLPHANDMKDGKPRCDLLYNEAKKRGPRNPGRRGHSYRTLIQPVCRFCQAAINSGATQETLLTKHSCDRHSSCFKKDRRLS
jgi:hypothetical protein